ncbi:hypothetical protein K456DRAFT_150173 [Colletotrichum gloeosporioides 23]|nr:hypothetical protein K456DRAFT_150173 [Colletotrichum gloeosporioides 23]
MDVGDRPGVERGECCCCWMLIVCYESKCVFVGGSRQKDGERMREMARRRVARGEQAQRNSEFNPTRDVRGFLRVGFASQRRSCAGDLQSWNPLFGGVQGGDVRRGGGEWRGENLFRASGVLDVVERETQLRNARNLCPQKKGDQLQVTTGKRLETEIPGLESGNPSWAMLLYFERGELSTESLRLRRLSESTNSWRSWWRGESRGNGVKTGLKLSKIGRAEDVWTGRVRLRSSGECATDYRLPKTRLATRLSCEKS